MENPLDSLSIDGLVILTGATGAGKSALALDYAERRGYDIISADSRQIYKGMEIGTDAPTEEERLRVRHHFVSCLSLDKDYSAFEYAKDALPVIDKEVEGKGTALVVGGSYLYLRALLYEPDDIPPVPDRIKEEVRLLYEHEGLAPVIAVLRKVDPGYLKRVDPNNHRRLLRAYEVYQASGKPFSSFHTGTKRRLPFPVTVISIERDRAALYDRINTRVERMMEHGLVEEVKSLLPYKDTNALRTIGYKEVFRYLAGAVNHQECADLIKKNTRTFARHQITTLKHLKYDITISL